MIGEGHVFPTMRAAVQALVENATGLETVRVLAAA
jgi:hypothetical protein